MNATHALTLELPVSLYERLQELASVRGVSPARFAREAIEAKVQPLEDLTAAYDALAEDYERDAEGTMLATEAVLRRDWESPEEDAAWSDL